MPTFADLKKAVMAYMMRDEAAFVHDGFNNLERAINDAHQWAQRKHIFERAKVFITVPEVSITEGADLSTAVLKGTTTAVQVRSLLWAWLPNSDGTGEFPIGIMSRDAWVNEKKREFSGVYSNRPSDNVPPYSTNPLRIVLMGTRIAFSTNNNTMLSGNTTTPIHFDAVKWFPDYFLPTGTDFFLDYCFDFMRLRSVYQLNAYLKDDQRVPLSGALLDDAWDSVKSWDTSLLTSSTEDFNLE